jgi:hypothetical protein
MGAAMMQPAWAFVAAEQVQALWAAEAHVRAARHQLRLEGFVVHRR